MRRSDGLKLEVDLYSATIAVGATGGMFTIFHAMLAVSPEAALERVAARLGPQIAQYASIERGFDPTNPFAQMLVSAPMRKLLHDVAGDPRSPLVRGFELFLDQRLLG
jgi:hypothetical protein